MIVVMRLCIILVSVLLVLVSGLDPREEDEDWNLWPLITPLLGVSDQCLQASTAYVSLLSEALTTTQPLSDKQKNALEMFDSNGNFPFFHEGVLKDVAYMDLCDSILGTIPDCRQSVPEGLRYLGIPVGQANSPGSETGCKKASDAKYCHNYYQYYVPPNTQSVSQKVGQNPKDLLNGFQVGAQKTIDLSPVINQVGSMFRPTRNHSNIDLDPSKPQISLNSSLCSEKGKYSKTIWINKICHFNCQI